MKRDLFLHGTSLEAAKAILSDGFDGARGREIWTVSNGKNYFLSVRKVFREEYGYKPNKKVKEVFGSILTKAFTQAQCTVAAALSSRRVVFLVDLSGIEYEQDTSCNYRTAVQTERKIPVDRIRRIWIDSYDISCMLPHWRSLMHWNPLSAMKKTKNPWMREMQEYIARKGFYSELDMEDLYEPIDVDTLKNA